MRDAQVERRSVAGEMVESRRSRVSRRVAGGLLASVTVVVLASGAWFWWHRSNLVEARREVGEGRFAAARGRLTQLASWGPERAEVAWLLGVCEQELGHIDAAVAAWARISAGTPFGAEAALRRGEAEMDRGRLDEAEVIFSSALRERNSRTADIRHDLMQLYWQEGRLDEARALIEENWEAYRRTLGPASDPAITNLRAHLSLDLEVYAIGRVQEILDRAGAAAPDSQRVWLAKANLAVRLGRFVEARRWLDRCLSARPDDSVAWSTALDLAMAGEDVSLAEEAIAHLTGGQLPPERVVRARTWLAARRGDVVLERTTLEDRLAREPGDTVALDRLSELEIQAGRTARAVELRRRKSELDRARRLYATRVGGDFQAEARDLAGLAETLGRWFEARGFMAIVVELHPEDEAARQGLARLDRELLNRDAGPSETPLSELVGLRPSAPTAVLCNHPAADLDFRDDAEAAGLDFTFLNGRSPSRQLPETMSGGVALLDYDGDGWLDVYAIQGGTFPPESEAPPLEDRLFRNRRDGTFEDVTGRSGLAAFRGGYGHGAAVGDVDNDGHPDLFVTRFGSYALYRNKGDGTFEDATARWGLDGGRDWPTSAAFADLDGDGDLDLYVCHYIAWDPRHPRICGNERGGPVSYCVPHLLPPAADHVFRNDGGRFRDVTREGGFRDPDGRGLGVLAADLDDDGRVDLFVANDGTANYLFRNRGGFLFEETGLDSGVAANAEGGYQAGMGIACGDLDRDGRPDLVVTNFYGESSSFFRNLGNGLFAENTSQVGLREATRYKLGFGTAMVDLNNDGYLDLATANGNVNDVRPIFPYAMPAQLLLGSAGGRLIDATEKAGPAWAVPRIGRGLAVGDLDNDGRIDLVILAQDRPLAWFHNRSGDDRRDGHFVTLELEGTASNRDAVGARVIVQAGGRRQVGQRVGGGSYQSASDPRLHFGLGTAGRVDEIEVRWPSGQVDRFRDLAVDQGYHLREGDPRPGPLGGSTVGRLQGRRR